MSAAAPAGATRHHLFPGHWGKVAPERLAIVDAVTGRSLSNRELDLRSAALAGVWRAAGLAPGDHVAVLLENHLHYLEVVWAAMRSGLVLTPVSSHLTAAEAGYIVDDSGAKALVTSGALRDTAVGLIEYTPLCRHRLALDGPVDGHLDYEEALKAEVGPVCSPEEPYGSLMLYSSGTTGRPKGIQLRFPSRTAGQGPGNARFIARVFGFDEHTIYYSPAPMYHSAPITYGLATLALGGRVVVAPRFEPRAALAAMADHGVTHSQWVPTHFVRLLRLDPVERAQHDLTSHRVAIHAAAPCPRAVKEAMMSWWGPILHEYYGGTESNGLTYVGPQEWLAHPGTVGRAVIGELHICDDEGREVPAGETGRVYFGSPGPGPSFEYHNDPDQTQEARHRVHRAWSTLGDVGHVDADGYLHLTDRATFMIVSGGVNIYPQEIENVLLEHPDVVDAAVIGVPNDDMGEEVKAIVQLAPERPSSTETAEELIAFARSQLSHFKCPRTIDFVDDLPRLPTGKLRKDELRKRYWIDGETRLI